MTSLLISTHVISVTCDIVFVNIMICKYKLRFFTWSVNKGSVMKLFPKYLYNHNAVTTNLTI